MVAMPVFKAKTYQNLKIKETQHFLVLFNTAMCFNMDFGLDRSHALNNVTS